MNEQDKTGAEVRKDWCLDNPGLTAALGYPVRCLHCSPDAGPIPPTHWTKHLMRHHPEASTTPAPAPAADLRDRLAADIECAIGLNIGNGGSAGVKAARDAVLAVPAIRDMQAELAALRQVARGYCPACGRGDAAPTVDDWQQERQRAEQAETAIERIREACRAAVLKGEAYARESITKGEALLHLGTGYIEAAERVLAALDPQEQP